MDTTRPAPGVGPEIVNRPLTLTAVSRGTVRMEELREFFDRAFTEVAAVLDDQGIRPTSAAFGRYYGQPSDTITLEVGFGTGNAVVPKGEVFAGELPEGPAARAVYTGPYDGLGEAWARLGEWIREQGLTPGDTLWEEYVTEPTPDTDPATLRTDLYWTLAD